MSNIEKTGSLYLGQRYDSQKGKALDEPVLYESRDLTTHAVCVGMTGSGKTGLCIDLLEEAALEGIPAILIDPKGDMTNLLLTFPRLRPEDFRPWINLDDARRKGLSPDEHAQEVASTWAKELGEWGISSERLQRLREAAEFVIYTPGSEAGQPISILQTLKAPPLSWDENKELLRERMGGVVTALLALIGIEADPVKSREHILLANIFEEAWRKGEDLDVAQLILRIQKPPMTKLGVFPIETFFPEKARLELAMALNGLIATPSFENWIEGQPLDIDTILHTPKCKPRVSIFYIAHLSDAERMFFITLLLGQVQTWMRAQSGTTSLRAILYCDEVFGYLPTHPANPPSKPLLLRLLKQARAFGLGPVLTTQNPVDLDYKALSNAGTWLIGKLQTERDKLRVLWRNSKKYEKKLDQLESKRRREERELAQDEAEYEARKREELLSAGESVLGFLTGCRSRRAISVASRKRRLTQQARADVEESLEAVEDYEAQIQDLQEKLEEETAEVTERWAETIDIVEKVEVRAKKADISVEAFGLAWVPRWQVTYEDKGVTRQLCQHTTKFRRQRMISDSELDARRRLAIEMLLESESLTDDLHDDEAEILLDWGMAQAEAYALATQEIADEEEARQAIDRGVTTVRRAMRFINDLVAERVHLSDGEMVEELLHLTSLARELPHVQVTPGQDEEEEGID